MTSPQKNKRPSVLRELAKSKSGLVGVGLLILIAGLAIYSIMGLPSSLPLSWNNGDAWVLNPINVPPVWFAELQSNYAPTLNINLNSAWKLQAYSAGTYDIYVYSSSVNFTWNSNIYPQNVAFKASFEGQAASASITWMKPQGGSIVVSITQPNSNQIYEAQNSYFIAGAQAYVTNQTGKYFATLTKPQVISTLFGRNGPNILNSTVSEGKYSVLVQIVSNVPLKSLSGLLVVIGNAYGYMGTDYQGKPVDLGLLAGLPNALEVGFLVAIVSVVVGIIFGGLSGYLGARKDGVMQWVTLVVLALPALPFLVVMSYTVRLNLIIEVLLIAALTWPFYAIISRTVALSIKSQTFVEADKAMGIPSYRVFFSHFMPRLVPVTVAYTVLGIPGGILLAETLAFLGIAPANIITWGRILNDAFTNQAAVLGFWWWVVFPGLMIVLSAVPFVLIGFALERVIAPRVAAK
jgi:peptide/nickel transport system permease protein